MKPILAKKLRESNDILHAIQYDNTIFGKNSLSIAAAVLYIVCKKHKQKISQAKIAPVANIKIMTLRKRLSEVKTVITSASYLN
ncbi:MAG TPA: hypothetical protein VJP58_11295 [Candidatus Nitrosocosmicus sp.]|nr:hypothetical protein [Candidatus Nitrosocosmicus sp.]